jgi:hypothetical protein
MSGSAWAWTALVALAAGALVGVLIALWVSYRRGRAAGHQGEHTRRRRGRGGDHR